MSVIYHCPKCKKKMLKCGEHKSGISKYGKKQLTWSYLECPSCLFELTRREFYNGKRTKTHIYIYERKMERNK